MIKDYFLLILIFNFFFVGCKSEIKEEFKVFEESKVAKGIISEDVINYSMSSFKGSTVLEYIYSFDEETVIDEEHWKRVLIEFSIDSVNNIDIEIPSNLIRIYGQLGDNRGRIEFESFKGKLNVSKLENGTYELDVLDGFTCNIKYNDSIVKQEMLFNSGDKLRFK